MNILVLCTGNSARSILLESLLIQQKTHAVAAYSAGSQPAGRVNPHAVALLEKLDHDTDRFRSKSWDECGAADAPEMDIVITVCGSAAAETCPIWPGTPLRAHWGGEDPAAAPPEKAEAALFEAHTILKRRADAFLAAPIDTMDRATLHAHLNACGDIA